MSRGRTGAARCGACGVSRGGRERGDVCRGRRTCCVYSGRAAAAGGQAAATGGRERRPALRAASSGHEVGRTGRLVTRLCFLPYYMHATYHYDLDYFMNITQKASKKDLHQNKPCFILVFAVYF